MTLQAALKTFISERFGNDPTKLAEFLTAETEQRNSVIDAYAAERARRLLARRSAINAELADGPALVQQMKDLFSGAGVVVE